MFNVDHVCYKFKHFLHTFKDKIVFFNKIFLTPMFTNFGRKTTTPVVLLVRFWLQVVGNLNILPKVKCLDNFVLVLVTINE